MNKCCDVCGQPKPKSAFSRLGKSPTCKDCKFGPVTPPPKVVYRGQRASKSPFNSDAWTNG